MLLTCIVLVSIYRTVCHTTKKIPLILEGMRDIQILCDNNNSDNLLTAKNKTEIWSFHFMFKIKKCMDVPNEDST